MMMMVMTTMIKTMMATMTMMITMMSYPTTAVTKCSLSDVCTDSELRQPSLSHNLDKNGIIYLCHKQSLRCSYTGRVPGSQVPQLPVASGLGGTVHHLQLLALDGFTESEIKLLRHFSSVTA